MLRGRDKRHLRNWGEGEVQTKVVRIEWGQLPFSLVPALNLCGDFRGCVVL